MPARTAVPGPARLAASAARRMLNGFGLSFMRSATYRAMHDQVRHLTREMNRAAEELGKARHAAAAADYRLALVTAKLAQPADAADAVAALRPLVGSPLPFVIDANLRPAARLERGPCPHRVFVCSLPKSGTYLLAELLTELGSLPTGLHLNVGGLSDYRAATPAEQRGNPERFGVPVPLDISARLVAPGQFAVGHLERSASVKAALGPSRIAFALRDVRDGLVSFMRYAADTRRYKHLMGPWVEAADPRDRMTGFMDVAGKVYLDMCRPMVGWLRDPDALTVRFEALCGDRGEAEQAELVRGLAALLDRPVPNGDPLALLRAVFGRPTKTWSGKRTDRSAYWSPAAEARFVDLGGTELNRELGYEV